MQNSVRGESWREVALRKMGVWRLEEIRRNTESIFAQYTTKMKTGATY
jgi:hypothetical protein